MAARWEVWLSNDAGVRIALLDTTSGFEYVKRFSGSGAFRLMMPASFDRSLIKLDRILEFWRSPTETGKMELDFLGFLRRWEFPTDIDGVQSSVLIGPDPTELLLRRIVAYKSGTAQASKNDFADDMMKEIMDENLGASAAAGRDITGLGFAVQADIGAGPTVRRSFAYQQVDKILQRLARSARASGTEVFFAVVPLSAQRFEFRTWTGQPGADRSFPGGVNPVVFGLEYGNLERANLIYDHTEEVTYVYAGGDGVGAARILREVSDATRIATSIWNRREAFMDARMEINNAAIDTAAYQRLDEGRPRIIFKGDLKSTASTLYGRDWQAGDKVSVSYIGHQFPVIVRTVSVSVDDKWKETIRARVEYQE